MDAIDFHMDNQDGTSMATSTRKKLLDPATGSLSLQVAAFKGAQSFATPHQHPYFSILLIHQGSGIATRDGATYPFNSPCLLCFSIYQPYAIEAGASLEGIRLDFHPSFFCLFEHRQEVSCNGVLFNNLYDTPVVVLQLPESAQLATLTGQLGTELQRGPHPDKDILISILKIFLIHASRIKVEQQQAGEAGARAMSPLLVALTAAIDSHFKTHRQAADYASILHSSTSVLNRLSKEYFRKTLTALIAERLIIEAKRQLYLTTTSVKEIAFDLGYDDEFYFSRFFKKNVGVSPQAFRSTVAFHRHPPADK